MKSEKELKMELLEMLMAEMDNSLGRKLKPSEDDAVVEVTQIESEEMPVEDLESMMEDKMSDEESILPEEMVEEEDEEDDEDWGDSRLMQKLMALKAKKDEE
jgi:hypothetical protein